MKRVLEKSETAYRPEEAKDPGGNMVSSILPLVAVVLNEREQEEVTLACQTSLAHVHQLLALPVDQQLSGPWLAIIICLIVSPLARICKTDKPGSVRVSLCQSWLLALLGHLAARFTLTVGREVWAADWQLPGLPAGSWLQTVSGLAQGRHV